jgi:hypothetical protein
VTPDEEKELPVLYSYRCFECNQQIAVRGLPDGSYYINHACLSEAAAESRLQGRGEVSFPDKTKTVQEELLGELVKVGRGIEHQLTRIALALELSIPADVQARCEAEALAAGREK